jgi:hypothetical protein
MARKQKFDLFVARNPDHIKDVNGKLNKYWECMLKDCEEEKEKLVNKTRSC